MTLQLTVLASGRGSNFVALHDAIQRGRCDAKIVCVISDKESAPVIQLAKARDIATQIIPFRRKDRAAWEAELLGAVHAKKSEWVVLAGFMRVLSPSFVDAFPQRILNVHPSLLPSFPGMHAVEQALAAGVRVSGCTVHLVDSGVDTGLILAQGVVAVCEGDDADKLHERIRKREHRLLAATIDALATGRLELDPVRWTSASWPESIESPMSLP
ncbi:MAG: phosphoribosylglycinamide formyltransferase-1 [Polyangiales bacterium]|jgi:phosphoribosylglycinamide formyltransferase-1